MNAPGQENSDYDELLRDAIRKLRTMQARVDELEHAVAEPIAVTGIGCRFPGAHGPDDYWKLLRDGVDAISEVPDDRWDADALYDADPDAAGRVYVKQGGFVKKIDQFDADLFGITPREAVGMDPQQRLVLETSWEALEDAAFPFSELRGSNGGVFLGATTNDYLQVVSVGGLEGIDAYRATGNSHSVLAGRLSYTLGLVGPCMTVDTACSASLVAVHLACRSLRDNECAFALAGGVNAILSPELSVNFCRARMLSPDGRCKTFDASANGYVRGEGVGVIVLKRLSDAVRDGDRVLAVIRGTAVNQDGKSSSLTVPNGPSQQAVIRQALQNANLAPTAVSYVEAHGTGTQLGDPIEMHALQSVFSEGEPIWVGSAKTNIGHLESAAGIAGLIKVILALQHRQIPPHLHFDTPNEQINWQSREVRIPSQLTEWDASQEDLVAGVSSFGFSGTNAHVVVQEAPTQEPAAPSEVRCEILALSAQTDDQLRRQAERYSQFLGATSESMRDICFTAATGRAHHDSRLAIITESKDETAEQLAAFAAGQDNVEGIEHGHCSPSDELRVGFLFTGQGSQYADMGRELYDEQPVFRAAIDRCDGLLRDQLDQSLRSVLYATRSGGVAETNGATLDQTGYTQPALFALEYALAELWKSWGIEPSIVMGHSVGEYAAACVAGVFSLEEGLELISHRARRMQSLPSGGGMVAVTATRERVQAAIESYADDVSIAAINGPEQVVISGRASSLGAIIEGLEADDIRAQRLPVSHAFHSPLMDSILPAFTDDVRRVSLQQPRTSLVANLSGEVAGPEVTDAAYWVDHVRQPVRFADGVTTLAASGCQVVIEIGPSATLITLAQRCLTDSTRLTWLPSMMRGRSARRVMLDALAALYSAGVDVDWDKVFPKAESRRVSLPKYPFNRQRYWFTEPDTVAHTPLESTQDNSWLPRPEDVARDVGQTLPSLDGESAELAPRLDEIALRFIIRAVKQLNGGWQLGTRFLPDELCDRLPRRHRPKLRRMFHHLAKRGFVEPVGGELWIQLPEPDDTAEELAEKLQSFCPCPEAGIVTRTGTQLVDVLHGEVEPLALLFPAGSTDEAAEFYANAPTLRAYNSLVAQVVSQLRSQQSGEPLRVLEVGAGTGGLTTHVLPELGPETTEYVFTDVSQLFLSAAEQRFSQYPFLKTAIFDVSRPPEQQNLEPGSFDLVLAANVLHATPSLRDSLANVRQLLKEHGWLVFLEVTDPPVWCDIVFGLSDGWWAFEDHELRPDYPLISPDQWCDLLADSGFGHVTPLGGTSGPAMQHVFLAQAAGTPKQTQRESPPAPRPAPGKRTATEVAAPAANDELVATIRHHAARVMRMQDDQLDPSRSLFDLGMDSLMAIELRTILERELDVELSVRLLTTQPSINQIVRFLRDTEVADEVEPGSWRGRRVEGGEDARGGAEDRRAHVGSRLVVRLQAEGNEAPLFFVPAGYGDLLAFRELGTTLGYDRPVFGLQPPGAKQVKNLRHMSIHRLVSTYVAEIKRIQPEGPYLLAGYSAGALVVVEVARELFSQDEDVQLLALLDPPARIPFWLDWFYTAAYSLCIHTGVLGIVRGLRSRFLRRIFHAMLDEGLRTHTAVTRGHKVLPYDGKITHFRARRSWIRVLRWTRLGPFWEKIARGGIEVRWIPGTHYGMLRGVGTQVVAEELRDCLNRCK